MPVMSMGFLVPPGEAVVWRGPMLHGAITQFLRDTAWGDLDYLIIDMPPGTGDIALTLSQLLPLTGAVVVCTPQDVALLDAVKAIAMFRKVNIPVLGHGREHELLPLPRLRQAVRHLRLTAARGAKAEELDVPFLGEVPIQIPIRERGDAGETSGNLADSASAPYFERICYNLVRNIAAIRAAGPAAADAVGAVGGASRHFAVTRLSPDQRPRLIDLRFAPRNEKGTVAPHCAATSPS